MRKNIIIVGSLLVDWVFVDNADGDSQVQNETKWTENGALKTGLLNSTNKQSFFLHQYWFHLTHRKQV